MVKLTSDNCMVCSKEFEAHELKSIVLANKFIDKFKICSLCLTYDDPKNDFIEVKKIVSSYLKFEENIKNS